jgi:hypothetical protein
MKRICIILAITVILLPTALNAQWSQAQLDSVAVGPERDNLPRSSLVLDDAGDLHLIFNRLAGGNNYDLYYSTKPNGGVWSAFEAVGDTAAPQQSPYLAVHSASGTPYLVYLQNGELKLARKTSGVWTVSSLPTPGASTLFDPTVEVDAVGRAHVAVIAQLPGGEYKIGYGYWVSPAVPFVFQIIQESELGDYGSGAAPVIAVRPDGSAAIAYRAGNYMSYRVDAAENASLGGTTWRIQSILMTGYQEYSPSLKSTPNGNLHLAFFGDQGWGFPGRVFYSHKEAGSATWSNPLIISAGYSGVAPKLAVKSDGVCLVVYEERSGNILTGNMLYASNQSGSWITQYLLQGDQYSPSVVLDPQGNGTVAFEHDEYPDSDIYTYGYVAPVSPPPNVTIGMALNSWQPPVLLYTASLVNQEPSAVNCDAWIMVRLPNGSWFGPVLGPITLTLPGGAALARQRTQIVPPSAPPGQYWYEGRIGVYPTAVWDTAGFAFTIAGATDLPGEGSGAWINSGDDLTVEAAVPLTDARLVNVSPNPFNPATTLRFELPAAARVSLKVFDACGRTAATLVDGRREAGFHEIIFDGSDLPSGIYFARLQAGEYIAVRKMVLVK